MPQYELLCNSEDLHAVLGRNRFAVELLRSNGMYRAETAASRRPSPMADAKHMPSPALSWRSPYPWRDNGSCEAERALTGRQRAEEQYMADCIPLQRKPA